MKSKKRILFFPLTLSLVPVILTCVVCLAVSSKVLFDNKSSLVEYLGTALILTTLEEAERIKQEELWENISSRNDMYKQVVKKNIYNQQDIVFIYERNGNLFNSMGIEQAELLSWNPSFISQVKEIGLSEEISRVKISYSGASRDCLVFSAYVPDAFCHVGIISPLEDIGESLMLIMSVMLCLLIILIVAMVLLILKISSSCFSLLKEINERIQDIKGGDYTIRMDSVKGFAEFTPLIESFNLMIDTLTSEVVRLRGAERRLNAAVDEKEVLLKEVHHRVKNNMQIISSLLQLQSSTIGSKAFSNSIDTAINRINTMALVHEKLYMSKNFKNIVLESYIDDLLSDLLLSNTSCFFIKTLKIEPIEISVNQIVSLGLIINELVTNTMKHGVVKDSINEIIIKARVDGDEVVLLYEDSGNGPEIIPGPTAFGTLGMRLILNLTEQLNGGYSVIAGEEGNIQKIVFPLR